MNIHMAVVTASLLIGHCFCKNIEDDDHVQSLPELAEPVKFKHYSGYLKAGGTRKLHYWFVESQGTPETDPVVVWLNGGPGCSSLEGMFAELGPFRIDKRRPTLHLNPYSWNKVANILFLESPAGVGFSYDPSKPIDYNYKTNDEETADDNYLSLLDFFRKFPQFLQNELFVTGESYSAVYVPLLVQRILEGDSTSGAINLKGYAIGNGYLDALKVRRSKMYFGYYHGLWSSSLWKDMTQHCCDGDASKETCEFFNSHSLRCWRNLFYAWINMKDLNPYNIYAPCVRDVSDSKIPFIHNVWNLHTENFTRFSKVFKAEDHLTPACTDDRTLTEYLNRADVKAALHVEESPLKWTLCSDKVHANYGKQYSSMSKVVKKLVDSGRLRTLIYNGDFDSVCSYLSSQWFVDELGYQPTSNLKAWWVNNQVAGYFRTHEGNLTFLTVKGAGHMVPEDKPEEALKMITNFLKNDPF